MNCAALTERSISPRLSAVPVGQVGLDTQREAAPTRTRITPMVTDSSTNVKPPLPIGRNPMTGGAGIFPSGIASERLSWKKGHSRGNWNMSFFVPGSVGKRDRS